MDKQKIVETLTKISEVINKLTYPGSNSCSELYAFLDVLRQVSIACSEISKAVENLKLVECDAISTDGTNGC